MGCEVKFIISLGWGVQVPGRFPRGGDAQACTLTGEMLIRYTEHNGADFESLRLQVRVAGSLGA